MNDKAIWKQFEKPFSKDILADMNLVFTPYIFYERDGKGDTAGYDCYCTSCNKSYYADHSRICLDGYTLKHRDRARCPNCGREATLFHKSRGKKSLTECRKIIVWRKTDFNHVYAQGYYVYKAYNGDTRCRFLNSMYSPEAWTPDPVLDISESVRYFFTPGDVRIWRRNYNYLYHEPGEWYEQNKKTAEPFPTGMYINNNDYYFCNEKVLENSFLKYSQYKDYGESCYDYWCSHQNFSHEYSMKFYCFYTLHPCVEMFIKMGLADFVVEAVVKDRPRKRSINWDGKNPAEIFKKLTKAELNEFIRHGGDIVIYDEYLKLRKVYPKVDFTKTVEFVKKYGYYREYIYEILKRNGITFTKAENYLGKQKDNDTALSWRDYLDMAEKIGYDMSNTQILFPKDLRSAHDKAVKLFNAIKKEIQAKEMKKLTEKLIEKYSFEYGDLQIVVPESMQDIINEGQALRHCVGGYAQRHANGALVILFIRRKSVPDVPYYTMELRERKGQKKFIAKIVQCHGYKNDPDGKAREIMEFENEFAEFLKDSVQYRRKQIRLKVAV